MVWSQHHLELEKGRIESAMNGLPVVIEAPAGFPDGVAVAANQLAIIKDKADINERALDEARREFDLARARAKNLDGVEKVVRRSAAVALSGLLATAIPLFIDYLPWLAGLPATSEATAVSDPFGLNSLVDSTLRVVQFMGFQGLTLGGAVAAVGGIVYVNATAKSTISRSASQGLATNTSP